LLEYIKVAQAFRITCGEDICKMASIEVSLRPQVVDSEQNTLQLENVLPLFFLSWFSLANALDRQRSVIL
jgi:hypothetical protein